MDNKEKTPGRHNNWPQLGSPQIEQIRKEKGKKNKTQGMKEINKKKICYACEPDNHEIKDRGLGKIYLLLTEQADE